MEDTEPGTVARRLAVLAFREAAQRVIDWIDENLLPPASTLADEQQLPSEITRAAEGTPAAKGPACPVCGTTDCDGDCTAGLAGEGDE